MQTKQTEGNWIAKQTSQTGVLDIIVDDKNWTDYGKIWVASTISVNKSPQECEANAKLIAQAPKLLEALIEALDQLESWNQESEDTFTMKRVREAIDKATL